MTVRITSLIFTTQRLPRLGSQIIISSVQEPQKCSRHKCTANDISQRHRDDRHINKLANAEISPVEHADWDQEEIGDGVLIAQRDAERYVSS